jgi:hypothetical protein
MDSKIYKFRLFTEKENDNYVRMYIERNGRINSEEIAELLYKGIVSLNEPSTEGFGMRMPGAMRMRVTTLTRITNLLIMQEYMMNIL